MQALALAWHKTGMDKLNPHTTHGVFKPIGYALIAFRTPDALHAATKTLAAAGFASTNMAYYSAHEMVRLAEGELLGAGPLAHFGYELDLLRRHKVLAQEGCVFLLVHAPKDEQVETLAALIASLQPVSAQHYGRFLIRDLTERPPTET